jgi:hypothetical protein
MLLKHSHASSNLLNAFQTQLPGTRELTFCQGIYILNAKDFKKNMFFQSTGNVYKMVYTLMKLS